MNKLLIVVDYQNDFVNGSLGFAGAEALDEVIAAKIKQYQADGDKVVVTMDTHEDDYLRTQEGRKLPVRHCIRNTEGWQVHGLTGALVEDCRAFEKPVFGSAALFDYLRGCAAFEQIELCGLVSNICVISNAVLVKCAQPETPVVVDAMACAAPDPDLHLAALQVMEGLQIEIINKNKLKK